ncbi:MAG: clostripain-related cysteine peptidase [Deferribacterales bacterium]
MAFYLADGINFYHEQQENVQEICRNKPKNFKIIFLHDRRKNREDVSNLKDITYVSDCGKFIDIPDISTETYSTDTLRAFFSYVRKNYPSDRYFYSITAHGVPPYMNDKGSLNALQIRAALKGNEPDVLGLDMCYMGSIESLVILKNTAKYIISASTTVPAKGNDYAVFTDYFTKHSEITPKDAARAYLNGYRKSYENSDQPLTVFITDMGEPLNKTVGLFRDRISRLNVRPYNNLPENAVTLFGINGDFNGLLDALKIGHKNIFTETYSKNTSLKGAGIFFPVRRTILNQTLYGYRLFQKQNGLGTEWADILRLY